MIYGDYWETVRERDRPTQFDNEYSTCVALRGHLSNS